MKMDKEAAGSLKTAVSRIFETPDGETLVEFLEETSGKYAPTYNPESATSIAIEAGKRQMLSSLRNLNRLSIDQIVEYYREQD